MTSIPSAAAPARLTELLRRAGVLDRGEVVDVAVETSRDTWISHITRLRLTYGSPADGGPAHVFVKSQRDDVDPAWREFGHKEVSFYNLVAGATPGDLLPRCYEASADPAGPWHLMLEDLTASHEPLGEWPLPPVAERWHAVVAAHARLHAAWWDDARLGVSIGTFTDDSRFLDRYLARMPGDLAAFADRLGDRLSPERKHLYERLIAAAPRLLERYRSHRNLTLVHGDAHVWNAMFPRQPDRDHVRLVDWDGWRIDTATDDLSYMLAMHWPPDWRRRYERDSLQRYHDVLVAAGVPGYSFDALWQDYRLSVLWQITTPMWRANHAMNPLLWWSNLEQIMHAVHDLHCLDLLD